MIHVLLFVSVIHQHLTTDMLGATDILYDAGGKHTQLYLIELNKKVQKQVVMAMTFPRVQHACLVFWLLWFLHLLTQECRG